MNKVTKQQQQQHPKKTKETLFHSLKKKEKKINQYSPGEKGMCVYGIDKTSKLKGETISY